MTLVGNKVRQYQILSQLGQGGMGDVYEALDETLQRRVALKAIKPGRGLDPVTRERFLREARILSQLDHPGICRIYDYIQVDGGDYLVLELIQGTTLTEARDTLDRAAKLRIARQITQVLAVAHAEDVIHRDLKPDNVMITESGEVKVLDFGLARSGGPEGTALGISKPQGVEDAGATMDLSPPTPEATLALDSDTNANTTMPGAVVGTPAFMSPEQARGDTVGPATDLYSLGLTLHWILAGGTGYEQIRDVIKLMEDVKKGRTTPLAGPGLDPHLVALVERLKSPSRASRPTATGALDRLDWILDKPRRRNRRLIIAAAVIAVLGFGLKYTFDVRAQRQVAEKHRAEAEGLIEFMVGDLREKLEPVGRLDILEGVGTKALEYFESREEDDLSDPDRFRLVRTLTQIGQVRLGEGDLEAAEAAFERARASATELHDHDPNQPEWLAALSAVHFWLGNVRYSEGDLDGADEEFRTYYDHSQKLRELEPDNPDWRLEVGYATTNLAALSEARGDIPAALAYLDSSIAIKKELVAEYPEDPDKLTSLANSLGWAGRALQDQGKLMAALEPLLEAEEVTARLSAADPRDMEHLSLLATQHQLVGSLLEQLGRRDEARGRYEADLAISRRLVLHDPANVTWQLEEAASLRGFGRFLTRIGETATARNYLEETVEIENRIQEEGADHNFARENMALTALCFAQLLHAEGRGTEASAFLEASIPPIENTGVEEMSRELAMTYGGLLVLKATLELEDGHEAAGRRYTDQATRALEDIVESSQDPTVLVPWTHLKVLQGDFQAARETAERMAAMGFSRYDFVSFCQRHGLPVAT